jgi:outer membrane receptor protein involved in Fe transport
LSAAWHRPTFRGDLRVEYNLFGKIYLQAGLVFQGGMKAQDPGTGLIQTLSTATDINFKARYFLSKQLSAFVQLNNLLSNQYPIYLNYPARGFQAMVGASWSF